MKAKKTIEVTKSSMTANSQKDGILMISRMSESLNLPASGSPATMRRGGSFRKIWSRMPLNRLRPPMMNIPMRQPFSGVGQLASWPMSGVRTRPAATPMVRRVPYALPRSSSSNMSTMRPFWIGSAATVPMTPMV